MALLLEPALDLAAVAACLILLGILYSLRFTFVQLAEMLDVQLNLGFVVVRPFGWLAGAIESTLVAWIEYGIEQVVGALGALYNGLRWSIGEAISLPAKVMQWVHYGIEQLILSQIVPLRDLVIRTAEAIPGEVSALVSGAINRLEDEITRARDEAAGEVAHALNTAEAFTVATVEGAFDEAEKLAMGAEAIALDVYGDLKTIEGDLSPAELAALVAAIPAALAFDAALVAEAGLGSRACRSRIGGICATDAALWAELLAGLVALGLLFNLRELVEAAKGIEGAVSGLVREAA